MAPVPDPAKSESTEPSQLRYSAGPEIIQVDSDSDSVSDTEDPSGGYLPLSQGPDGPAESEESDDDFADFQTAGEKDKVAHVQSMPEDQADTIRAVMANIKLPNIPAWAKSVPEERWMTDLMKNIHHQATSQTQATSQSSQTQARQSSQTQTRQQSDPQTRQQSDPQTRQLSDPQTRQQSSPQTSPSVTMSKTDVNMTSESSGANLDTDLCERFDVNFEAHFPTSNNI